ncbi:hypothetical protein EDD17DRAFT_1509120 [Pisolithus thermaeus]|nr:hypothetical protein EDD17DRAFT_1509120 [Pisolithus thermaeus]
MPYRSLAWSTAEIFFFHAGQLELGSFSVFSILSLSSLSLSLNVSLLFPFEMAVVGVDDGPAGLEDATGSMMCMGGTSAAVVAAGNGVVTACAEVDAVGAGEGVVAGTGPLGMGDALGALLVKRKIINRLDPVGDPAEEKNW